MGPPETPLTAARRLLQVGDVVTPIVVRLASTIGLADALGNEARSVDELAEALGADRAALLRLLRALVPCHLLREVAPEVFEVDEIGEVLRTDHPLSMRDAFTLSDVEVRAWSEIEHSLRTGDSGFARAHGESYRRFRADHPEEDERMDRAHRAATRVDSLSLLRSYDWASLETVVDVGGGTGQFLIGLLSKHPHLRATLFDLPAMVARSAGLFEDAGLADRCRRVGGDFFVEVPAGASAYVLKAVLGGWRDEEAVRILSVVRTALAASSRVLVIEPVLGGPHDFTMGDTVQLQSLVLYGSIGRTLADFEAIAARAGLACSGVVPRPTLSIIELRPLGQR